MAIRTLVTALISVASTIAARASQIMQHPYGPHQPSPFARGTFFQGWYTRVSTRNYSSTAVIIGQVISLGSQAAGDDRSAGLGTDADPPVMCMIMHQPSYKPVQEPPAPYTATQYFHDLRIETGQPVSEATGGNCQCPAADFFFERLPPPHFKAQTAQPASQEPLAEPATEGEGHPSRAAHCSLNISPSAFKLSAHIPGIVTVAMRSIPSRTDRDANFCYLPWSHGNDIAEGWAQYLGPLIGVHYSLLSMRTPVSVYGKWAHTASDKRNAGISSEAEADPATGQHISLDGIGLMHTEAQWGNGFPNRWIWAEGQEHKETNATECLSSTLCGGDAGGVSFVLAGGDLAHALSPPLPQVHLYLFSYRNSRTGTSITVDPYNPALVTGEEVNACAGTARITLSSFLHTITVELKASPDSFFPAACPTRGGFLPGFSVESFAATAHIRVMSRYPAAIQLTSGDGYGHKEQKRTTTGGSKARQKAPQVVASTTIHGAAMEFGGQYRCKNLQGAV